MFELKIFFNCLKSIPLAVFSFKKMSSQWDYKMAIANAES